MDHLVLPPPVAAQLKSNCLAGVLIRFVIWQTATNTLGCRSGTGEEVETWDFVWIDGLAVDGQPTIGILSANNTQQIVEHPLRLASLLTRQNGVGFHKKRESR